MVRSNKRRAAASEKKRVLEDTPHLFGPREATRNLDKVGVSRNSPFFITPPLSHQLHHRGWVGGLAAVGPGPRTFPRFF